MHRKSYAGKSVYIVGHNVSSPFQGVCVQLWRVQAPTAGEMVTPPCPLR
jgi:hypothetical protein